MSMIPGWQTVSKRMVVLVAGLLVFCGLSTASPVRAVSMEELFVYPSFQYFQWKEFSDNRRLLRESGPLFGAGAVVGLDLYEGSLMLTARGEVFGGVVDYAGETQQNSDPALSRLAIRTDVVYVGTKAEGDLGWRFRFADAAIEPFVGIGNRWWLREIQDSTATTGNGGAVAVNGYNERWFTFYTRLGARGSYSPTNDLRLFVEGGAKYPFYTENNVDFPGAGSVTVKPDGQWSAFAEVGARYKWFRPSLFYEGFRFAQSPAVAAPVAGGGRIALFQPESESDIFGINLGVVF